MIVLSGMEEILSILPTIIKGFRIILPAWLSIVLSTTSVINLERKRTTEATINASTPPAT